MSRAPGWRLLLVTDAWTPQVNGVVRTWTQVREQLSRFGIATETIHPGLFPTLPAPRYPQIRLACTTPGAVGARIREALPAAVHLATEGPLGLCARAWCLRHGVPFTTSYHTQFPLYLRRYFGVPVGLSRRVIRWFHAPAAATLAPTPSVVAELQSWGVSNAVPWCRGVDAERFRPGGDALAALPRPRFLYAGRIAAEKNIEAFLRCDLPGCKVVVGDGPLRARLERRHPEVHWRGFRFGEALAAHYAGADVLVFPSRTDTFGLVILEANACGTPAAAHPVTGPIDVVVEGVNGALDPDLRTAALRALELPRERCVAHAATHSWRRTAEILLDHLQPHPDPMAPPAAPAAALLKGVR